MGHPDGAHTHGSGGPGAGVVALVVVLAIAGAAVHAAWHGIVEAVEITGIVIVSVIGAAVLGALTYAALRIRARVIQSRQDRPGRPIAVRLAPPVPLEVRPHLESSHNPARELEAPRQAPASWPLPGRWEEIRSRIGHDDERR